MEFLAGCTSTILAALFFLAASFLCNLIIYGAEGFSAQIQLWMPWYTYPVSIGQMFLICLGLFFIEAVLVGTFTMMLSEWTKNSVGTMAVVIAITFLARLVEIPVRYRFFSQIWAYLPVNLIKESGVFDLRLVSVFGIKLTTWQFAPLLYVLLIAVFCVLGKIAYRRH